MNKIFGSNIYIYQKIQNEIELLYPFPFPNLIEYPSKAIQRNAILCCGIPPPGEASGPTSFISNIVTI